jgi:hypothetical protein
MEWPAKETPRPLAQRLSARLALGTDPLPDTTAATSALADDAQTPVNAPQTAGTATTTPNRRTS